MPAGSYLSIATLSQNVSPAKLTTLQTKLTATKTRLESNDQAQIASLTREELLGDLFYAGTLGYFAQYNTLSHLAALTQGHSHTLAVGYGSYGYEPAVNYLFGIPASIEAGGVAMNIRIANFIGIHDHHQEKKKQLSLQIGLLSSALEHAVPEQMFSDPNSAVKPEAVSAVKALQKAAQQGQRIYHLTAANKASALANIHHDQKTLAEINAALSVGKEVVTHTDAISVPGWSGAGYIILDPVTGDGSYKIGGGKNGSELNLGDLGIALGALSGGLDGVSMDFANDGLPYAEDLPKMKIAKTISLAAKVLGATALLIDIYNAMDGLADGSVSIYNVIGKLSMALFGFAVGNVAVAAISATFVPMVAGVIAAVFIANLAIVLADFSAIYYSYWRSIKIKYAFYVYRKLSAGFVA